jgi:xanthine dehydrogenase YagR molybdenum-binding subunit
VAPQGSPFRPLYDDTIRFSGQSIALVVAEEAEIAGFAASLVRVEYDEEAHVTDLYCQRDAAFALETPANPAEALFTPRGRAARAKRHSLQPRCATRGNIMSRSSITTQWKCTPRR